MIYAFVDFQTSCIKSKMAAIGQCTFGPFFLQFQHLMLIFDDKNYDIWSNGTRRYNLGQDQSFLYTKHVNQDGD